jgi:hypothetical protein
MVCADRRPTPFLAELYDQAPALAVSSLAHARRNLSKSRVSASDFIDILGKQKLTQFMTQLEKHATDL